MKQLPLITHTIHQTEIPTLLDSWVTNVTSDKMLHAHARTHTHTHTNTQRKKKCPYIFVKM